MVALDNTMGALLIGVVVSATLYGITFVQTCYYYNYYLSDPWYIKLLVAVTFVLDTCNQALITHSVYTYLVTHFGIQEALGKIVWSLIVEGYFTAFTALAVQSFLAMRIYILSNKNWLATGSVMVLAITSFVVILVSLSKAIHFQTFTQLATIEPLLMVLDGLDAAGNLLITVLLCSFLYTSRTGFRRSDRLVNKLIVFSIHTGFLTSVSAIATLICMAVWPKTLIYLAFYFLPGRLYCNSLLATLNARKIFGNQLGTDEVMSYSLRLDAQQQPSTSMVRFPPRITSNAISIKVDTMQE